MATMTNATQMFTSCSALETIYATSFTNVISSSGSMFYGYNKLVGGADGFVPSSTSAGSVCKLGAGGVLTNPNSDVREWFRVFVYDDGTLDFTVSGSADGSKTLLDIRAAVRQREVPGRGRHPRTQLPHAVPNGVDALRHGDAGRREHELLVLRAQRHHLVRGAGEPRQRGVDALRVHQLHGGAARGSASSGVSRRVAAVGIPKATRRKWMANTAMQEVATVLVAHSGLVPEGSSRSRAASELAEMFARADGETEALPDKGPDAAARSALEFLRRLTESLGLVE